MVCKDVFINVYNKQIYTNIYYDANENEYFAVAIIHNNSKDISLNYVGCDW